uniref:HDC14858 n=1 Tax=Drosophila melanogaster TaxID=7227 RepID=Q6IJI5_DROME|nr:TPA_inf: HDC14858 [Drosophila melanogaster]
MKTVRPGESQSPPPVSVVDTCDRFGSRANHVNPHVKSRRESGSVQMFSRKNILLPSHRRIPGLAVPEPSLAQPKSKHRLTTVIGAEASNHWELQPTARRRVTYLVQSFDWNS